MTLTQTIKSLAIAATAVIAFSASAQAALLTYDFEGIINVAFAGVVFGSKTAGDTFTGSFTLDTDTTETFSGSNSAGSFANYAGAFEYTIDGTPLGGVELFAAESVFGYDTLALFSASTGISLDFHDSTATALSGLGVPASPMALSDWDYIRVYFGNDDPFEGFVEDIGSLTSLTLQQSGGGTGVPAPGALALLGLGLIGLGAARRRAA